MGNVMKRVLGGAAVSVLLLGCAAVGYVNNLDLDSQPLASPASTPADLGMFKGERPVSRGRVLAVVTSTAKAGTDVAAGLELTELSRAYYTFAANGFDVEIASPKGGRPPVRMDDELIDVDHAFLNDPAAQALLSNTIKLDQVDPARYDAVYFVGGKGAMFDFPGNPSVQRLIAAVYDAGGVIGAVCHGPAALVDVQLASGKLLLAGKRVTGFTNEEELFLIKDARRVFPFLLEESASAACARQCLRRYRRHPRDVVYEASRDKTACALHPGNVASGEEGIGHVDSTLQFSGRHRVARIARIILTLGIVAAIGYVAASPYLAVRSMRDAAMAGDAPGLAGHVDFPAVKDSLKASMAAAAMKSAGGTGQANPLTGAGAMFAMALMGTMVDAMASPEGLATMMRRGTLAHGGVSDQDVQGSKAETAQSLDADMNYRDFSTFVVTLKDRRNPRQPRGLIVKRHGIASWKPTSLELPGPPTLPPL